jgi:RHS repeat-associated protein
VDETFTVGGTVQRTTVYGYDPNGALTSRMTAATGESITYGYDLEGRLSGAMITRTGGGHTTVITTGYQYTDDGLRVREASTTTIDGGPPTTQVKRLLLDSNNPTGYAQVLEERTDAGGLLATFVYGLEPLSQSQGGMVSSYLLDGHSGLRLLTDATGVTLAAYRYDAFGNLLTTPGPVANPLLYQGERFDTTLGQYYLRARFYDVATGRFTVTDPFFGNLHNPLRNYPRTALTPCFSRVSVGSNCVFG